MALVVVVELMVKNLYEQYMEFAVVAAVLVVEYVDDQ